MPIKRNKPKATGIRGIKQDGPNRFLVVAWRTDRKTGRQRKREGVAKSLREAVALQERLRSEDGLGNKPIRVKWCDFVARYVEERVSALEPTTQERYVSALAHVGVRFGDTFVDAIEPLDIEEWMEVSARKYAPATVNGWLRIMRAALQWGIKRRVCSGNPAREVRVLPVGRTKGRRGASLSAAELRALLEAVDALVGEDAIAEDVGRMVHVLAWTGCRISELCALEFDDWERDQLHIRRALSMRKVKAPKNRDARIVTVVAPLADALSAQREWLQRTAHPGIVSGLVFPSSPAHAKAGAARRGADIIDWQRSRSVLNRPLRLACERAGVTELSPHAFRRTLENVLRKANVDELVRRSVAGWRTKEAERIYSAVDREDRAQAGRAMLRLVYGGEPTPAPTPEGPDAETAGGLEAPTGRTN